MSLGGEGVAGIQRLEVEADYKKHGVADFAKLGAAARAGCAKPVNYRSECKKRCNNPSDVGNGGAVPRCVFPWRGKALAASIQVDC